MIPDRYFTIPWKRHGRGWGASDCWGVVALWFEHELGITLPSYVDEMLLIGESPERRDALIRAEAGTIWRPVPAEEAHRHDVVMMRSGRYILHVGVLVSAEHMLHSEGPEDTTPVVQPLQALARRIIAIHRHQDLHHHQGLA